MRCLSKISLFKFSITCLAVVGFLLLPCQLQAQRALEIKSRDDLSHKSGKLGAYRALVIGINDYQDKKIPTLKTAVNDAREFASLLKTRYGFQVTLLLDRQATKQAIMDKMRDLAVNTSPDESVLIYYAGHGDVDRVLNDGWWVPADATGGNPVTYLDNNYVQRVMRGMKARHVLLVSDSCYSGTLFGEGRSLPTVIDDRYYLNLYNEKSRWGMTSGNKTPVSDSGSEGHSIFAYQLIKALTKNEKPYITTQEIYSRIAPIIANNSEQQPLCSPVRDTGDQGGGFVFVASRTSSVSTSDSPSYSTKSAPRPESDELVQQKAALERERQELAREKQDLERQKTLDAEREQLAAERRKVEAERQQLAMAKRPAVSTGGGAGRDGRFISYNNGTVSDTKTNLMWAAKDNGSNINWANAESYCENYRGGGYTDWRMPTQDELAGLYDANKSQQAECNSSYQNHVATDLIHLTCFFLWASETRGAEAAYFSFLNGYRNWFPQSGAINGRALPVRSGK
ncbi:MAG: caspase family protein [Deltaproteobacteria bacterium]|nr:caspase family protein [Deltaproteobacteria bacterium]